MFQYIKTLFGAFRYKRKLTALKKQKITTRRNEKERKERQRNREAMKSRERL